MPSSRRGFLKSGAAAGAAVGLSGFARPSTADADTARVPDGLSRSGATMIGVPFEQHDVVRVGVVGLGNRGTGMTDLFSQHPNVRITAICDVREERVRAVAEQLRADGHEPPATY